MLAARGCPFDVALVDVHLAKMGGLCLGASLLGLKLARRVVIMAANNRFVYAERALKVGANGFIEKSMTNEMLRSTVALVLAGMVVFPEMTQSSSLIGETNLSAKLSDKELEVLRLLTMGHGYAYVGSAMNISPRTVSSYKQRIMAKAGARSMVELIDIARAAGLTFDPNRELVFSPGRCLRDWLAQESKDPIQVPPSYAAAAEQARQQDVPVAAGARMSARALGRDTPASRPILLAAVSPRCAFRRQAYETEIGRGAGQHSRLAW